ncbi:MAG: hypothetical protein WAS25_15420 [Geothrix sp.]|uniref:hypothetical protein n=1 Tax=Geothrix sp. TaxID=1962974 RepID=UPI003BAF653E
MTTLAVFRREWIGRRNVFLLALGMGCIQLVGMQFEAEVGKTTLLAVGSGTLLAWVVAALFGATMVGRDLEERRFGFLLNQPLRTGEIFAGKVGAGVGMAVLAAMVLCLPTLLFGGLWRLFSLKQAGQTVGTWLAGSLVCLLLFHAVSIQVRSRSPWLALDLAAWATFAWGVRQLSLRLIGAGTFEAMLHLWLVLLVVVTLGLALAGYLQVAQGRADLQRGHRWVSVTLALSLGLALLVGSAQAAWVLRSKAESLKQQAVSPRIR